MSAPQTLSPIDDVIEELKQLRYINSIVRSRHPRSEVAWYKIQVSNVSKSCNKFVRFQISEERSKWRAGSSGSTTPNAMGLAAAKTDPMCSYITPG